MKLSTKRERTRHQRSLKHIVVDAGKYSTRCRIGKRHSHSDPDPPPEANPEDRIDDDSHRQRIRCHVSDDADENGDRRQSLRAARSISRADRIGDCYKCTGLAEERIRLARTQAP
jgi:hypothetical protein